MVIVFLEYFQKMPPGLYVESKSEKKDMVAPPGLSGINISKQHSYDNYSAKIFL